MDSNVSDLATTPKVAHPTILESKLYLGDLSQKLLLKLPLPIARAGGC
jgi:hypothetical protein